MIKKALFSILSLIFGVFSYTTTAQTTCRAVVSSIEMNAAMNTVKVYNTGANCYVFSITLPSLRSCSRSSYNVFWAFGNGDYSSTSTQGDVYNIKYCYSTNSQLDLSRVKAETTPIKVDIDGIAPGNIPPARRIWTGNIPSTATTATFSGTSINAVMQPLPSDKNQILYVNRQVVMNNQIITYPNIQTQYFTAIVTFKSSGGQVGIQYDPNKLDFVSNTNYGTSYLEGYPSDGMVIANVSNGYPLKAFFTFALKSNVGTGGNTTLTIVRKNGSIITPTTETINFRYGTSYDPNNKLIEQNGSTTSYAYFNPQTNLKHIINFQNTGTGPANFIKLEDNIPEELDITNINNIKLYLPNSSNSYTTYTLTITNFIINTTTDGSLTIQGHINWDDRYLIIELNNDNAGVLQGLNDTGVQEWQTMGKLSYGISTLEATEYTNRQFFGTPAKIYFDENAAVITNTCAAEVDFEEDECPANITIDKSSSHGSYSNYIASDMIIFSTNARFESGSVLSANATHAIILNHGTSFEAGSLANLFIAGCTFIPQGSNKHDLSNYNTTNTASDDLHTQPNPFSDQLEVVYSLQQDEQVSIQILDLNGKIVAATQNFSFKGNNSCKFDTQYLPKGVYLCLLKTATFYETRKIVKM
jgi:hypothetical protein